MGANLNTSERLGGLQRYDYSDICLEPLETTLSTKSHLLRMGLHPRETIFRRPGRQNRTGWLKLTEMRTKECMKTCNLNERMQLIYKKSNSNSKIAAFLIGNCFPKGLRPLLVMLEVISTLGAGLSRILMTLLGCCRTVNRLAVFQFQRSTLLRWEHFMLCRKKYGIYIYIQYSCIYIYIYIYIYIHTNHTRSVQYHSNTIHAYVYIYI